MEKKKSGVAKGTNYEKLREELNDLGGLILKLSDYKNLDSHDEFDHLEQNIKLIKDNYTQYRIKLKVLEIPQKLETKLKQYIANLFIEANSIEIFTKFLNKIAFKIFQYDPRDYSIELRGVSNILSILITNTDSDLDFGTKICEEDDLFKLFYKILNNFKEKIWDDDSYSFYRECVHNVVSILYNTLIYESTYNIMKMREYNFLEIIKDLVVCDDEEIKVLALLFMSYVVDENSVDMIAWDKKLVCRIISNLEISVENGWVYGFTTEELAKGILQLSRNDKNKLLLVEYKILDILHQLLDNRSIKIVKTSLLILWSLAFVDSNKKKIKKQFLGKIENTKKNLNKVFFEETGTAEFLLHFEDIIQINPKSGNEIDELRQTLDKVLWVLKNDKKPISNEVFTKTSNDMIMISYCHKDEKIVKKIYNELRKRRYKLWIDFNNMEEKIMESMALAVEQSKAVIICASYSYQMSENCRQEMTYAMEHKKRLVPLIVEKDLTANGRLGIGLTGLLRVNMSGKYDFNTSVANLTKHLDRQVFNILKQDIDECDKLISALKVATHDKAPDKGFDKCDNVIPVSAVGSQHKSPNKVSGLALWTDSDVIKWFDKIGVTILNLETKWDGRDLECLRQSDWGTFVNFCKEDLGISKLRDLRIINDELKKL